jgi:hypothetical protein
MYLISGYEMALCTGFFRVTFWNVFDKMTLSAKFVGWEVLETDGTEINFMYFSLRGPRCRWAINIEMNLKLGEMMWTGNHKDTSVIIELTDTHTHTKQRRGLN